MNKIWTPRILLPELLLSDERLSAARSALETPLRDLSAAALESLFLPRLDVLPEYLLDLLAEQYHVDFYEPLGMSVEVKRAFIRNAILWHRFKGTPAAVETVLSRAFEKATVDEWFEYGGEPYFFRIHVDINSDDEDTDRDSLNRLRKAVHESKNARSWLEYWHFFFDSDDTIQAVDSQALIVVPDLYDRYDYRRSAPAYDGVYRYDGATVHGAFESGDFEQLSLWNIGLSIADTVTVSLENALHASLAPWHEEIDVGEGETLVGHVRAEETVSTSEDQMFEVTLIGEEPVTLDDAVFADVRLSALDSLAPYDDAELEMAQVFRYDGRHDYSGAINYGSTLTGDTIFVTDDEDQKQWALLQRELERDFDEPCTCGAADYDWWYSSIRLGEERFLITDPQVPTLLIKCRRCGHVIAEYIVPNGQWEVRV